MASHEGKGSIVLEIIIVILVAVLIAVILIPGKIWKEEAREEKIAHDNIASIYQSEKFYFRKTQKYTEDPAELLRVVRQDSSLLQKQQIVNYTREINRLIGDYLQIPYIKSIVLIDKNMTSILEDLEGNKRNFKAFENIKNEADNLKLQLTQLHRSSNFPNYVNAATYLDSLVGIRTAITDFSLQNVASRAKTLTDTIQVVLPNIKIMEYRKEWKPLNDRIKKFVKRVLRSDLTKVTSVGDRVRDFRELVDRGFDRISKIDIQKSIDQAAAQNQKIDQEYNKFLKDYIVTSKLGLYRLSTADSLVLHLTEDNFYSPVTKGMYKIIIDKDSAAVKVESPILLNELKEKSMPVAKEIASLPAIPAVRAYLDTLNYLKNKAYTTRKKLRRNTDLFIAYKELEDIIDKYNDISFISAYFDLEKYIDRAQNSESYSDIKKSTEDALNGIRIFNQAYSEKFFGNLDSLHRKVQMKLHEFDSLLTKVRRLPKDIENFENDMSAFDQVLNQVKNPADMGPAMDKIENELKDNFLFASKGKTVHVYGVFNKSIKNFGYIYKDSKSWEEKKKK